MKRIFAFLWLAAVVMLAGCAAVGGARTLQVNGAWARTAQAGGTSAIYFVIDNPQSSDDTLLSAQCDAAMMTELHMTSIDAEGTMKMNQQENVPIPAGQQVAFEPGGLHVMLMNLKQDLKAGDRLTVTLTFENAGTMQVEAEVKTP